MTRHWSDHFRAKDYVTVHDRTMITDLIIEAGNDKEPYCELATQEDFDRF